MSKRLTEVANDHAFLEFLKVNHPEMFYIFAFEIMPFYQRVYEKKRKLEEDEEKYKELCEQVKRSKMDLEQARASLPPWQRNSRVYRYPVVVFEWFLSAGLALTPILSTLTILGIEESSDMFEEVSQGAPQTLLSLLFSLFFSFSLVWLTSVTVTGLLEKRESSKTSDKSARLVESSEESQVVENNLARQKTTGFSLRIKGSLNRRDISTSIDINTGMIFALLWFSEAALGIAVIPSFIIGKGSDSLGILGRFGIFFGISIFAMINILYAINKSYRETSLTPKREKLARHRAEYEEIRDLRDGYQKLIDQSKAELKSMEETPYRPSYRPDDSYFSEQLTIISNFAMQGKEPKSLVDIYDEYQRMISIRNTANGTSATSPEFLDVDEWV